MINTNLRFVSWSIKDMYMALPKLLLFLCLCLLVCKGDYPQEIKMLPSNYDDVLNDGEWDGTLPGVGYESTPAGLIVGKVDGGEETSSNTRVVDVTSYGAIGDGTDATQAFAKAWKDACTSSTAPIDFLVPKGSYYLKPIAFYGPCRSAVTMQIKGTILAPPTKSDWNGKDHKKWIEFKGIDNLRVEGGGTINGNGKIWWDKSCKVDKSQPCTDAPTAMTFHSCKDLNVANLNFKNSQKMHLSFDHCNNIMVSALTIIAPATSPNTDGIHVTHTKNIDVNHCSIETGDDCISIVSGSSGITMRNINCGPGHGISIGSLGHTKSKEYVSNVLIDNANLHGATNGARIKTWQGGHGYAKNITFQNIIMDNVKNPIIIDQNYCDSPKECKQQSSAVAVSNIYYKSIKGTSATQASIIFDCSNTMPCKDISLEDITLLGEGGKSTYSTCNNVKFSTIGTVIPTPCAKSLQDGYMSLIITYIRYWLP